MMGNPLPKLSSSCGPDIIDGLIPDQVVVHPPECVNLAGAEPLVRRAIRNRRSQFSCNRNTAGTNPFPRKIEIV